LELLAVGQPLDTRHARFNFVVAQHHNVPRANLPGRRQVWGGSQAVCVKSETGREAQKRGKGEERLKGVRVRARVEVRFRVV
jgi:hypothetical protein